MLYCSQVLLMPAGIKMTDARGHQRTVSPDIKRPTRKPTFCGSLSQVSLSLVPRLFEQKQVFDQRVWYISTYFSFPIDILNHIGKKIIWA